MVNVRYYQEPIDGKFTVNSVQTFYLLPKIKKEKYNDNISEKHWSRGLPAI